MRYTFTVRHAHILLRADAVGLKVAELEVGQGKEVAVGDVVTVRVNRYCR